MPGTIRMAGLIGACVVGAVAVAANATAAVMARKINRSVRPEERISPWGWDAGVRGRYKQLFPHSRVALVYDVLFAALLGGAGLLVAYDLLRR
jgi:hypothetical protein